MDEGIWAKIVKQLVSRQRFCIVEQMRDFPTNLLLIFLHKVHSRVYLFERNSVLFAPMVISRFHHSVESSG